MSVGGGFLAFLPAVAMLVVLAAVFVTSPFSNVLNVCTVPLGYEWQSCPNCPAVGVEKMTWAECQHCGDKHRENFCAAAYRDGESFRFCSRVCLDAWGGREQS